MAAIQSASLITLIIPLLYQLIGKYMHQLICDLVKQLADCLFWYVILFASSATLSTVFNSSD